MIIIIDGYNVLKQIFPGLKRNLNKQRQHFILQLARYKATQGKGISQIIVVFDAGGSTHAIRTIESNIVVIFSGTRRSADEWIIDYAGDNRGKEILVITHDRAVIDAISKLGFNSLGSHDFYTIVQEHNMHQAITAEANHHLTTNLQKYSDAQSLEDIQITVNPQALDFLMEQASYDLPSKNDESSESLLSRKKKSFTLSKKDRQALTTIKKLVNADRKK